MPPIPSTLGPEITSLVDSVTRRASDLSKYQIPRLRSCKGPLATQQQYAAEVREDIDALARQIESLDIAVDDQRGERNRRELRQIVEDFKETLGRLRKDSRNALLVSKRAIDATSLSNREELLRSSALHEKQDLHEKVAEDALMTATNDVTASLQRTIGLMQGELERSVLSTQLLDASTANLRSASSTHDVLDGLMITSKHMITALEKSDWLDRLLIFVSLLFFILVVLFILKKRLVDRGLRVAFWWTRFIPAFSGSKEDTVMGAMEKGSAGLTSSVALVSSTVAAASAFSTTLSSLASEASVLAVGDVGTLADPSLEDILAPSSVVPFDASSRVSPSGSESTTPEPLRDEL